MPIGAERLTVLDILRSIPNSVLTLDPEQRVAALNEPAEVLTGVDEAVAPGRPCATILNSEICGTARCPFERSFSGGKTETSFNVQMRDTTGCEGCHKGDPKATDKGTTVAVAWERAIRASYGTMTLKLFGYKNVKDVSGSMLAWEKDGLPHPRRKVLPRGHSRQIR